MTLEKFQQQMTEFVFHKQEAKSLSSFAKEYSEEELNARLAIYQNNTFYSLIEALKDLYPTVLGAIGNDLFSVSARIFLDNNPPSSAAMVDFGQQFPSFLSEFSGAESFPYIQDLAQLDLIRHLSYHAADDIPVPHESFAQMDIEFLANSKVKAIDSAKLLASDFAIFDIWEHEDNEQEFSFDVSKAQAVLSIRPYADVDLYSLNQGNFIFLKCLTDNMTINEALMIADEESDQFNPTHAISFLIQSGFCAEIIGE
ncbi:DNA-binding domain-containing protein [Agarilytica rhodophyticola]|uniref:HvfC/BufC N-terminal domain-containing protein n=1 Tax=Agarilytica rhodophyticola TaxID=1737490 RepID=UPI000B344753|nr:DNA-binding domain-containing protein [Agarilytica rhodophyticola]